ncbi:MAG: dienelactone hydrolase family protein [Acidobacteriota bacterium]|nr:dienelactone hydrolase family protein [Acidobacteriota bacterium]
MKTLPRLLCFLAIPMLLAAFAANARGQQAVTFPSGESTGQGLLYLPQGTGPHPALIVIHEWWGLNDWIKQEAAGYAAKGYVALAVDLYHGQVATTPELAHELSRGLPQDQGVRDLTSAFTWLQQRKDVKPDRIGAVGWCFGGGYALQLAIAAPLLRAVAINYGSLATDKTALARIHAAVLGNFGGQDRGIPPQAVHNFVAAMQSLGKPVDAKIYPDAGHAFENPNNAGGYRSADSADALARIDRFFAEKLKQ